MATGAGLTLNVSETDNAQDLGLVREVAPSFRVSDGRAVAIRAWLDLARPWRLDSTCHGGAEVPVVEAVAHRGLR